LAQYLLQPGDQIAISVWQEPRLDRQIVVAPDGSIALPLAGRIQAGGRTAAQVEQAIAGSFAAHYADELDVTVHLLGRPDQLEEPAVLPAIYVMGEVTRP
jgi:polysaccharide export outer membrane protein